MPQKHSLKDIESAVASFLRKKTGQSIPGSSVDLVKKGIVSSLTMFELIDFIEKKFKVEVDVLSINPDNFNSLKNISKQVAIWMSA